MSPQQKRQNIRERLTQAREEFNQARAQLSELDEENAVLPAPDGSVALRNATMRYKFAHETYRQVLDEFTAAVLRGKT